MRGALNPRLLALLAGGVVTTLVAVVVWIPAPGVTRADLLDAGVTQDFVPRKLSCWAIGGACPDGGACQLSTVVAVARTLDGQGQRHVIFPRSALRFRRHLDAFDERSACRVTNLTWGQVANFDREPTDEELPCACQALAGPPCLFADGGPLTHTVPVEEVQWGAGCRRRICGGPSGNNPVGDCRP